MLPHPVTLVVLLCAAGLSPQAEGAPDGPWADLCDGAAAVGATIAGGGRRTADDGRRAADDGRAVGDTELMGACVPV